MRRLLIKVLLVLLLSGCATVRDVATSPDTFAVCKTADVVTTIYGVHSGAFVEKNKIVAGLLHHGYLPLIALSFALWYAVDAIKDDRLTLAANAITCPLAVNNLLLLK